MEERYNNYHKHSHRSNVYTVDTHIRNEDYCKRAVELGHTTLFSTEHGYGGSIFEIVVLAEKYNLKPIYAIEGYIVADATSKDKSNYHIVIVPKNDKARKQLNLANSRANMEGYYYKPRLFLEDLLSFNKDDFYLTTACCGGILKDEESYNNIFIPLARHFEENLLLEIQNHNTESQAIINRKALELKNKFNLKLIHANDSHYIYPKDAEDRADMLNGKGMSYGEEDKYILDYPNYETIIERYEIQGVLDKEVVEEAINNTLIFDNIENIKIDKLIKMPNIYKDLDVTGRINKLKEIINKNFKEIVKTDNITNEERPLYIEAIREEMKVIEETKSIHSMDYFLFNEKMVGIAINKYGGYLTPTSRGSGGAFLINKILGLTQLDRIRSEIPLYPERFMSAARLLGDNPPYTSSLPDFDMNVISDEPFIKASRDLLGENGCYAMTAYGTMGESEAFRNTCRSKNLNYDEYNEIAKDLDRYRNDKRWGKIIEEANKFNGVIISASIHPCSYLLLDKDLREELGVIKIGDAYCCPITSSEADEWHYLKNDYLKVESISLSKDTFDLAEVPIPSIYEFKKMLDEKVWDIYGKGLTCTINQFDSDWATSMSKKYKPHSVKEVAMFNGAIRPNFNDYRDIFMSRNKDFSNGNSFLDKLFEPTDKYILYQENLMQFFEALGIKPSESINLIKKISKKKIKPEMFENLVDRLKQGWLKAIGNLDDFDETWNKILTFMSYGYNTPHSLAMAYDSLYEAYAKSHYPLEYYSVALEMYRDDARRTELLTKELDYFNIKIENPKFGKSKGNYFPDKANNIIYKGVGSIKYINNDIADRIYEISQQKTYNNFIELLIDLEDININSRQLDILIKLNYFGMFGKTQKLLKAVELFNGIYPKKQFNKSKLPFGISEEVFKKYSEVETRTLFKEVDKMKLIEDIFNMIPNRDIPIQTRLNTEIEMIGYVQYKNPKLDKKYVLITDVNTKYTPVVMTYSLNSGATVKCKIPKRAWQSLEVGSIIYIKSMERKCGFKKVGEDGKGKPIFEKDMDKQEWWINSYEVINGLIDNIIEEVEDE